MEEVLNSISHAIELAKRIESELSNDNHHPHTLSSSIDEVVNAFIEAKQKLIMLVSSSSSSSNSFGPMQEWVIKHASYEQSMDQLLRMKQQPFDHHVSGLMGDQQLIRNRGATLQIGEIGGRDVEGGGVEASPPSRPRKSRKNDTEKKTMLFPAPQVGNTEMPPEDGFTWRKYGQKEILGSKYPRSYYRCTHQKLYECPAKKQVQRLDHSPNIFEVTYRGEHTCHMSSTAPSSFPPQQQFIPPISSTTSVSMWLQPSTSAEATLVAGPSASGYVADFPVAELADAMFNSGSSSGHSMENLFPAPGEDRKWEPSEKNS